VETGKVIYLGDRAAEPVAKEYAVLFRVLRSEEAQFKVFCGDLGEADKAELAAAMEAAARILRM